MSEQDREEMLKLAERLRKLIIIDEVGSDNALPVEAADLLERLARSPAPAHDLYKTGDPDAPNNIKDRNGEVVLGLCRRCRKGECELTEPCTSPAVSAEPTVSENLAQEMRESFESWNLSTYEREGDHAGHALTRNADSPEEYLLLSTNNDWMVWQIAYQRGIAYANAENAALRKDAERYRWLTSGKRRDYVSDCVLSKDEWEGHLSLSEAIDAAIAIAKESSHDN